ncbi:ComF family protein [Paenibacillus rhizophilus]|uniref:ComF family protein n=1 Tax=Paenibacillus rhizophilus TaxID=1850366 RepID=A0A3N9P4R8_9BACL|nr:ComF family protein [Paenibacillus rhizophilus]RQW10054.1 ComF family protein [Paenibacillus rhizophilus]
MKRGSWLHAVHSLLAPVQDHCLTCGREGRLSSQLPGICEHCAVAVPWILHPRCQKCGRHVGCPDCARGNDTSSLICNRSAVAYSSEMREWLGQYKYRGDERFVEVLGVMLDRAYRTLKAEMEAEAKSGREAERAPTAKSGNPATASKRHFGYRRGGWEDLLSWLHFPPVSSQRPRLPIRAARSGIARRWEADLLVPVPVSDVRLAERGFNQAERLAQFISARRDIPVMELLVRAHHTGKQSFKTRAERLADMKRAFVPNPVWAGGFAERLLFSHRSASGNTNQSPVSSQPLKIVIVDDIYTTGSTIRACADVLQKMVSSAGCQAEIYSLTWARS